MPASPEHGEQISGAAAQIEQAGPRHSHSLNRPANKAEVVAQHQAAVHARRFAPRGSGNPVMFGVVGGERSRSRLWMEAEQAASGALQDVE